MEEEFLEETSEEEEETSEETLEEEEETLEEESEEFGYAYPIYDQTNTLIENPDLEAGYLKKEYFTIHHNSIPEVWHYVIKQFDFTDGEIYKPSSNEDAHVRVIDDKKGIFEYLNLEGEEKKTVIGQTIAPAIDQQLIPAWDETQTIFRYVEYTEKELADRDFLTNGPQLLAEAQETIDDLLLIIADLVGAEE